MTRLREAIRELGAVEIIAECVTLFLGAAVAYALFVIAWGMQP